MVKLIDYCLNPEHERGKHKARVFASALGLTQAHAGELQRALVKAATEMDAEMGEVDAYGQRYVVDFEMEGPAGRARAQHVDGAHRRGLPTAHQLLCLVRRTS